MFALKTQPPSAFAAVIYRKKVDKLRYDTFIISVDKLLHIHAITTIGFSQVMEITLGNNLERHAASRF